MNKYSILAVASLLTVVSACGGKSPRLPDDPGVSGPQAGSVTMKMSYSDGNPVLFYEGDAAKVSVAGEFNNWSGTAHPMSLNEDGVFEAVLDIPEGTYRYMLIIDGSWVPDPANPETVSDGRGGINSVLRLR